jgi:hypothetical protein
VAACGARGALGVTTARTAGSRRLALLLVHRLLLKIGPTGAGKKQVNGTQA